MFLLFCFFVLEFERFGITLYPLAVCLQKNLGGSGRSIMDHEHQQRVCFFVLLSRLGIEKGGSEIKAKTSMCILFLLLPA